MVPMSQPKTVYVLFGEMGCGKTYQGSAYAKRHDFKYFDGDSVITPRMLEKVSRFAPIPNDVLCEYMAVLFTAIDDQTQGCDQLVVSQALYRNKDRECLRLFLESNGYQVRMWWVQCKWHRNIQNLLTRPHGWKWVWYWLINKPFFQKPTHQHSVFYNVYWD
jgi:gluconate kinase